MSFLNIVMNCVLLLFFVFIFCVFVIVLLLCFVVFVVVCVCCCDCCVCGGDWLWLLVVFDFFYFELWFMDELFEINFLWCDWFCIWVFVNVIVFFFVMFCDFLVKVMFCGVDWCYVLLCVVVYVCVMMMMWVCVCVVLLWEGWVCDDVWWWCLCVMMCVCVWCVGMFLEWKNVRGCWVVGVVCVGFGWVILCVRVVMCGWVCVWGVMCDWCWCWWEGWWWCMGLGWGCVIRNWARGREIRREGGRRRVRRIVSVEVGGGMCVGCVWWCILMVKVMWWWCCCCWGNMWICTWRIFSNASTSWRFEGFSRRAGRCNCVVLFVMCWWIRVEDLGLLSLLVWCVLRMWLSDLMVRNMWERCSRWNSRISTARATARGAR